MLIVYHSLEIARKTPFFIGGIYVVHSAFSPTDSNSHEKTETLICPRIYRAKSISPLFHRSGIKPKIEVSGFLESSIRERRSPGPASSSIVKTGQTSFVIVKVGQTKIVTMFDLFGTTARSQMHHGRFKGCLPFKRVALYHNAFAASIAAFAQKRISLLSAITSAAALARAQTSFLIQLSILFPSSLKYTNVRTKSDTERIRVVFNPDDRREPSTK